MSSNAPPVFDHRRHRIALIVGPVATLWACNALLGIDPAKNTADAGGQDPVGGAGGMSIRAIDAANEQKAIGGGGAALDAAQEGAPGQDAEREAAPEAAADAARESSTDGGRLGQPCSASGELACAGNAQHLQLVCNGREWVNAGTCAGELLCDSAPGPKQGTCQPPVPECIGHLAGDFVCIASGRYACGIDLLTVTSAPCPSSTPTCSSNGSCALPPSCFGGSATCGPAGRDNCCESFVVPGGAFFRFADQGNFKNVDAPATVSDFRLDKLEVTVRRFRLFLDHYPAGAPDGAGANPHLPGSGWQSSWNANLAGNPGEPLSRACGDAAERGTFTSFPDVNEDKPMNCVSWYEAFLFCFWDGGGRLPTSAEWNYAASGGPEQRVYPWSVPPNAMTLDPMHANYQCDGGCAGVPLPVGNTSPQGGGRWGQADLAGNVREWILDLFAFSPMVPCNDCAQLSGGPQRGHRGGGFKDPNAFMQVVAYTFATPETKEANVGFRCARPP